MRIAISSLVFLISLSGYAADKMTMYADPNKPQFVVTLPANPTTGYKWTAKSYDKTILNMVKSQYISPQTHLIGAGGNMTFTFALIKGQSYPSSTNMVFSYARAWEPGSGTLKNVTVKFKKH